MTLISKIIESVRSGKTGTLVDTLGIKNLKVMQWSVYGLISNAPPDSIGLLIPINGQIANSAVIADLMNKEGLPELEPGEVVLANYLTQSHIIFKSDGGFQVNAKGATIEINDQGEVLLRGASGASLRLRSDGKIGKVGQIVDE